MCILMREKKKKSDRHGNGDGRVFGYVVSTISEFVVYINTRSFQMLLIIQISKLSFKLWTKRYTC